MNDMNMQFHLIHIQSDHTCDYTEGYKNICDSNDSMQLQTLHDWICVVKIYVYFAIND